MQPKKLYIQTGSIHYQIRDQSRTQHLTREASAGLSIAVRAGHSPSAPPGSSTDPDLSAHQILCQDS